MTKSEESVIRPELYADVLSHPGFPHLLFYYKRSFLESRMNTTDAVSKDRSTPPKSKPSTLKPLTEKTLEAGSVSEHRARKEFLREIVTKKLLRKKLRDHFKKQLSKQSRTASKK